MKQFVFEITKLDSCNFEDLLNLRVRINVTPSQSEELQKQLFKKGWKWGWYTFEQKVKLTEYDGIVLYPSYKYFLHSTTPKENAHNQYIIDYQNIIF